MMHSSTSPLYPIIASNDITAAMMDGSRGTALITEAIQEAVGFRQMMGRIRKQFQKDSKWFFQTWNAEQVSDGTCRNAIAFEHASEEMLVTEPGPWMLDPADTWHGFSGLVDDYAMLDPIKVSVVTPGIQPNGALEAWGIPAQVVTAYLDAQGIQVEKTSDYTILFLFTIGITKGKWGTLVNALLDFKRDFDQNLALEIAIPSLVAHWPKCYGSLGLRDLASKMHLHILESRQMTWQARAVSELPVPRMTPSAAYQRLVQNDIELLPLERMADRVVATGVVPYPPGIPLLMPGESAGAPDGPHLTYLRTLERWDERFPGFEHDTHGIDHIDGRYFICCCNDGHSAS